MSYKYKDAAKLLKRDGFRFDRYANGSHEIWINELGRTILISRCGSRDRNAIHNFKQQLKRLSRVQAL